MLARCSTGAREQTHPLMHSLQIRRHKVRVTPRHLKRGAPSSPFCWANLGSMEWWRSNRNGRPEIVSRKLSAGRPEPSSAQVSVQKPDANLGHRANLGIKVGEPSSGAHVVRPHTQDLRKVVYSILNEQNEYRDRRRLDQKSAQTHAS